MIKILALAPTMSTSPGVQVAYADMTCQDAVTEKKLSGAARTSFLKKCEIVATAKSDATAATRKLNGAVKTSFSKKCVSNSVGAQTALTDLAEGWYEGLKRPNYVLPASPQRGLGSLRQHLQPMRHADLGCMSRSAMLMVPDQRETPVTHQSDEPS
jgi:hypothetical protein